MTAFVKQRVFTSEEEGAKKGLHMDAICTYEYKSRRGVNELLVPTGELVPSEIDDTN